MQISEIPMSAQVWSVVAQIPVRESSTRSQFTLAFPLGILLFFHVSPLATTSPAFSGDGLPGVETQTKQHQLIPKYLRLEQKNERLRSQALPPLSKARLSLINFFTLPAALSPPPTIHLGILSPFLPSVRLLNFCVFFLVAKLQSKQNLNYFLHGHTSSHMY